MNNINNYNEKQKKNSKLMDEHEDISKKFDEM